MNTKLVKKAGLDKPLLKRFAARVYDLKADKVKMDKFQESFLVVSTPHKMASELQKGTFREEDFCIIKLDEGDQGFKDPTLPVAPGSADGEWQQILTFFRRSQFVYLSGTIPPWFTERDPDTDRPKAYELARATQGDLVNAGCGCVPEIVQFNCQALQFGPGRAVISDQALSPESRDVMRRDDVTQAATMTMAIAAMLEKCDEEGIIMSIVVAAPFAEPHAANAAQPRNRAEDNECLNLCNLTRRVVQTGAEGLFGPNPRITPSSTSRCASSTSTTPWATRRARGSSRTSSWARWTSSSATGWSAGASTRRGASSRSASVRPTRTASSRCA